MNNDLLNKIYYCLERIVVFDGIDDVLAHIVKTAATLTRADAASMRLFNMQKGVLELKTGVGLSPSFLSQAPLALGEGIIGKVVEHCDVYRSTNVREDPACCNKDLAAQEGINAILSVPLKDQGSAIGALTVYRHTTHEFTDSEILLMSIFASQAVEAIEKTNQLEELKRQATRDCLTEIYNRRYLLNRIDEELKRAKRHDRIMSLIFIDLDDFKNFNDNHGHLLGDKLLQDFCRLTKEGLRQNDLFGRFGGEEFIIVAPETDKNGAKKISLKLLNKIRQYGFLGKQGPVSGISFSAGIASFPADGNSADEMIQLADEMMYQVKVQGKNGVKVANQKEMHS